MISIDNADLDTYCGRIGNLYGRYRLSPPFELRRIAADWKANGIALSHIVAVIDRHLADHRRRYNSGSGDALFSWLDEFIRKTWYEQHASPPQVRPSRPRMQPIADREWVDRQQSADHEVDAKRGPTNRGGTCRQSVECLRVLQNRSGAAPERKVNWPETKSAKADRPSHSLSASRAC